MEKSSLSVGEISTVSSTKGNWGLMKRNEGQFFEQCMT